jgi:hypothetical protein
MVITDEVLLIDGLRQSSLTSVITDEVLRSNCSIIVVIHAVRNFKAVLLAVRAGFG